MHACEPPQSDLKVTNRLRRVTHNADGLVEIMQMQRAAALTGCLYVRDYIFKATLS